MEQRGVKIVFIHALMGNPLVGIYNKSKFNCQIVNPGSEIALPFFVHISTINPYLPEPSWSEAVYFSKAT
jgi:hypothetical protein